METFVRGGTDRNVAAGRLDPRPPLVGAIVSGGQTGVDRAALDVALELGLARGGWCPRGRRAEDGPIDGRYPLRETPLAAYAQRTAWNLRDSDATLVLLLLLLRGRPAGGTRRTIAEAARRGRGRRGRVVVLGESARPGIVAAWLRNPAIRVLNVAGPARERIARHRRRRRGVSPRAAGVSLTVADATESVLQMAARDA